MPSFMIIIVPEDSESLATILTTVGFFPRMPSHVYFHVKFLRKYFSADSALIAHGMLEKSSSLLPQARQVDLADFYAIP